MRCFWVLALLVATTGFMSGCNNCDSCTAPKDKGESTEELKEKQNGDQASIPTPQEVVHTFLEAARTGNKEQVNLSLTPTARTEVTRVGLDVVGAVASNMVKFEVGEMHQDNPQAAAVESCLTRQANPNSSPQNLELAWVLRLTDKGWRVKGVILPINDKESLFLDYEKPEQIFQQRNAVASQKQNRPKTQPNKTILR